MRNGKRHERISLVPLDNRRLAALCGQCDEHIRYVEQQLGVDIHSRGNVFEIAGADEAVNTALKVLKDLYQETASHELTPSHIHMTLQQNKSALTQQGTTVSASSHATVLTKSGQIKGRNPNQQHYLERIATHDLNFGIGPAGTGKTYLAVAHAVMALERQQVQRLILVRPAVEAGEHLGFLPGDFSQKIDPYLRPLYDALYQMLGYERVTKYIEKNIIEVAPLAYMRGRTLNDAFIILDEAQNTTREQMKMFLTRLGLGSKVVITGDLTQIDLPRGKESGLKQALHLLNNVSGISVTSFNADDVVRHPLVEAIVKAYEQQQ